MEWILFGLIVFFGGTYIGQKIERYSWFIRVNGQTPHCVNGQFFYIISEAKWLDVQRQRSKDDE